MEACLSAHFVSRTLRQFGHEPRIVPAIYVKPFVKGQKNDYDDAEAIAGARPSSVTCVLCASPRTNSTYRPAIACGRAWYRGERRTTSPPGALPHRAMYCGPNRLTCLAQLAVRDLQQPRGRDLARISDLIVGLYEDWLWLDERIEAISHETEDISQREANCIRLIIYRLISTAVVAAIVRASPTAPHQRRTAAWPGHYASPAPKG